MNNEIKILIVDDEQVVRESLKHWFEEDGYKVDVSEDAFNVLEMLQPDKWDIMLVDIKMPKMSGLELLEKVKVVDPECVVIIITAYASVPTAVQALKNGAFDYVTKPIDPDELSHLIEKAIKHKNLKRENIALKSRIDEMLHLEDLVGESPEMKKVFELIQIVAPQDTTVMIRGESGTGKELIARAIHINSTRKYYPIIPVNCGAFAESLLESELFGHEKGAFTGAQYKRKGKIEMADGGTLFLDEVGSLSPKMQVELLRVIESKQFHRVGGNELVKVNFRLISATNEPLEKLVEEGNFREDLYYRLNVFAIYVPPLRERRSDIPVLAKFFINKFSRLMNKPIKDISKDAMEILLNYNWSGNVRELENAIERAMVVGTFSEIQADNLPFKIENTKGMSDSLSELERLHIKKVLFKHDWNVTRAAAALEIDRVTLYNKIKKYELRKE
ncbi:MAG: sigma-54-dependent Fis family transcriptional regulator [Ignavibacteria bacterium]|nr:sigma-54-dependent Fis family transcriptional regulator [Ignavibacteria bacterium]